MDDLQFDNRTVVVTGAAKGIGAATARAFVREGARVALLDVDDAGATLARELGDRAKFFRCDVSRDADVRAAIKSVVDAFGDLAVLVNNAGIQTYGTCTETSEEDWDRTINANLKSAFLCSKHAIPSMLRRSAGGVVVNVASVQAFISQNTVAAYTTSKTALLGLTRSIAIDYAPKVRCVAVCPGTVDTPMLRWAIDQSPDPAEVLKECNDMHPVKRIAKPEEVADLILFLASDKASFITGQPFRIDGGLGLAVGGSKRMKITDIKPTTVTVPLEAPLRHANGCHWGRFVRTIVEVETDEGITGLGEMGGGGESAEAAFRGLKSYLVGHDPMQLEALFWKICNPTASLYNNRAQLHAAIEFACIDIVGKRLGIRACDLLGGALREQIPFASYLFFRHRNDQTGAGGEQTPEQMVAHARDLARKHGFTSHKLKAGVFAPEHELKVFRGIAEAFPDHRVRIDPNAAWSVEDAIRFGQKIEDLNNDYFEDPCFGMEGMRRVRQFVRIPTATNTIVVNFEQLAACVRTNAVDVILLDTTFWGGLRQAWKAGVVCEKFQLGVAVHSSGELGIQLATMLHLGAALPNLSFAADAHYHHLTDDVIAGGKMKYVNGAIAVPSGPGLGVSLDREKVAQYAELYRKLGNYPYDRDPQRPGWFSVTPERNWAKH